MQHKIVSRPHTLDAKNLLFLLDQKEMAKRKTETSEYDTRSVRYAQRCKKTESASVCVKSEESSSESDDDEQTEFDIEMLEDKVDRMTKNLAYLKVYKKS